MKLSTKVSLACHIPTKKAFRGFAKIRQNVFIYSGVRRFEPRCRDTHPTLLYLAVRSAVVSWRRVFLFPWKCSYLEFSFWWEDDFNSAQVKILLSNIDSNCHLSPIVYDLSFCQSSPKNWKTEKLLEIAVVRANCFQSFRKFRVSCWFGTGFYVSCHFGVRNGIHGNLVCKNPRNIPGIQEKMKHFQLDDEPNHYMKKTGF